MPSIEKDDGEMSYRRGFEHGALETFHAVERFLIPPCVKPSALGLDRTSTDGGLRLYSVIPQLGGWPI